MYLKRIIGLILSVIVLNTSVAVSADTVINTYSNGDKNANRFSDGIFTALSEGNGFFAIALYKEDELVGLTAANRTDSSATYKLNTVVNSADADILKVFRFDEKGNPLCVNTELLSGGESYRIYVNETFDTASEYETDDAEVMDGVLKVKGNGTDTRIGIYPVYNSGNFIVIEADFGLGFDFGTNGTVDLICNYKGYPCAFVTAKNDGIHIGGNKGLVCAKEDIDTTKPVNIAVMLDLKRFVYDIYVNKVRVALDLSLLDIISSDSMYNLNLHIPRIIKSSCEITVDNVRAYSGNAFCDIGKRQANVHRTDYSSDMANTTVYKRPTAEIIAKNVLENEHPRVMINSEKLNEIKNSSNATVIEWKNDIILSAESAMSAPTYCYETTVANRVDNLSDSANRMMDLGLAYMITCNSKYAQRAYLEAKAIIEKRPNWGSSKSALDVGEISFILSICYDWLYEGLSTFQKNTIADSVMENSIYPSYKTYHGRYPGMEVCKEQWWSIDNNWNAVCNGGAFIASVAFMEEDSFVCATLAEATLRGLEYLMARFAPAGAWSEGTSYWAYTMKFLTAAMSTLEANCNSLYGLDKAIGFDKTSLYSLSMEGKAGTATFGDSSSEHIDMPFVLYWSRIFDNKDYTSAVLYTKDKFDLDITAFDLIYLSPKMLQNDGFEIPTSYYFEGTEVVSFSSGNRDDDSFIAISGGKGHSTSHDQLDSGAVVVDMKGERVLWDMGAEHYEAEGYFGTNRHLFFRARPESHNIFIINPENTFDGESPYYGQNINAVSAVDKTTLNLNGKKTTMMLTDAYARDVSDAKRTISLDLKKAIIEDSIELKNENNNIYWNWYLKKDASGEINCQIIGNSVTLVKNGKNFTFTFVTDSEIEIYLESAAYYVNVDPDVGGKKQSNDDYKRLVVKMTGASGKVSLKTVIE